MARFITTCKSFVTKFENREEGQDLLEYALLVALIAVVAAGAVKIAGENVSTIFGQIVAAL